jgi:hypothetical protein
VEHSLQLDRFAVHYVDPGLDGPAFSAGELHAPPPEVEAFLLGLAAEIWNAPDSGATRSARFNPESEEARETQALLRAIAGEEEGFFSATRHLAELLHARSHPSASPGLLGVARLSDPEAGNSYAALLKIRYRDEALLRLRRGEAPLLEVQRVEDVLLKEIQKGAIYPHPEKADYDLKVIDAQSREDPAAYFTERFLGCVAKKSDDLQVKKLAPALEQFAEAKAIEIAVEKFPRLLQELKAQPEPVTPARLAEAVSAQEVFGPDFEPAELVEYLEENRLGDLDIPIEGFQRKRKGERRVVYRFTSPEYEGLEISGPPEAFEGILRAEGGQITFTIRTTSEGFRFGYG